MLFTSKSDHGKHQQRVQNSSSQLWRNHSNAICQQALAKDHGTTCATATLSNSDAVTPMCLQAARCKRPYNYMCNSNAEQHWCSHPNTICKQRAAKDNGSTCAVATQSNCDAATPMEFASTSLQKPIEVPWQDWSFSWPKPARKLDLGAKAEKSTSLTLFFLKIELLNGKWKAPKTRKTMKNLKISLPQPFRNWTATRRWENEAWETSLKNRKLNHWSCENEAFVGDPQNTGIS